MKQARRAPVRLLALLLVGSILPACGDSGEDVPGVSVVRSFATALADDTQPPVVSVSVALHVLSPANGKMINVGLAVVATDDSGQTPDVTVRVFSSEPAETDALPASLFRLDALPLRLRAERVMGGQGRVYLIVARARDASGNLGFAGTTVVVPKNGSPSALQTVEALAAQALAILTPNGSGFTPFPAGTFLNTPPTAADDVYFTSGGPIQIGAPGVLGNDSDPDLDLVTAREFSRPAHGVVSMQSDGSFTYTPDATFTGTDSFTYVVSDAWTSSLPATVNIQPPLPTSIDFTISPTPSAFGQPVVLSAVVSAAPFPQIPTGFVRFSFSVSGTSFFLGETALDEFGGATLVVDTLPMGTLALEATYGGDTGFVAVSVTRLHVVN
jgi:hypothetical protein